MTDLIFLKDEEGRFTELRSAPYDTEADFQELIAKNPALLLGERFVSETSCGWLLVDREMGVPNKADGGDQWYVDHLFLDRSGTPTLVEVKRSTDTRVRREVVGQMLDYAANASVYWRIEEIRTLCAKKGSTPETVFGISAEETETFWNCVCDNLRNGKMRLIFAADFIPRSLRRIIEFLNNQMVHTEVIGLEIQRFISEENRREIFVPKVVGKTVQAGDVKRVQKRTWSYESFLDDVESVGQKLVRDLAEKLLQDIEGMHCRVWYGNGKTHASIIAIYDGKEASTPFFSVYPWMKNVRMEIYFQYFKKPFDTVERRKPLAVRFEKALGISIPEDKLTKRPGFDFSRLQDENRYKAFLQVFKDMIEEIRKLEK